ncbi:MAG: hypothetical protein WC422_01545 [Candidatus Paceibacterota bacterium]|jgi:hypothetical protein
MYLAKMIIPESDAAIDRIVFDYLKDHLIYGDVRSVVNRQGEQVVVLLFGTSFLVQYLPKELLEKWLMLPIETISQYKLYHFDIRLLSLHDCDDEPIA